MIKWKWWIFLIFLIINFDLIRWFKILSLSKYWLNKWGIDSTTQYADRLSNNDLENYKWIIKIVPSSLYKSTWFLTNNLKIFINLVKDYLPNFYSIITIVKSLVWSTVITPWLHLHIYTHTHAYFLSSHISVIDYTMTHLHNLETCKSSLTPPFSPSHISYQSPNPDNLIYLL